MCEHHSKKSLLNAFSKCQTALQIESVMPFLCEQFQPQLTRSAQP